MRLDLFEELAPVCPRCLHAEGRSAPLAVAERIEMRGGRLWHGMLHCSDRGCWREYPVIDGVPVLTPEPGETIRMAERHLLARTDLPMRLAGLVGDALGPGGEYDTARQHLSIYAGDHYADWCAPPEASSVAATVAACLDHLPQAPAGPVLDIGGGPGRAAWEVAKVTGRSVLSCDLALGFLRIAQRLAAEGRAEFGRRRIGLVYDPAEAVLPDGHAELPVDFWALDATQLPFTEGTFAASLAINVVDCVPSPASVIREAARVTARGGAAAFTTPYDWSVAVPETAGWLGGHSQRGPTEGAGEPVLRATLDREGFEPVAEVGDLPWSLRLHARSVMQYRLHMVACRRR